MAIACGFSALAALPGTGAAGHEPPAAQRLRTPDHLTSETKAELDSRMGQHGETMSNLLRSVVLLDRPRIRVLAGRIADEEVIARTSASMPERKPLALPKEFSAEQTKLSVAARELAVAANDGVDDRGLAERFAAVTSTCVTCHSVYLHGRPDPRPFGPKGAAPGGKR